MDIGIDIGTSEVKALPLDDAQCVVGTANKPLPISRPQPLWSEHDPCDWWTARLAALRAAQPAAYAGVDARESF